MRKNIKDWSEIKLVVTDIDGTLVNSAYQLSDDFYAIFDKLRARGLLFAVASGRQYFNLVNRFESIKEELIFIAENGSYVVDQGEEILVQAIEHAIVKDLIIEARTIADTYLVLCGKKKAYVESTHAYFISKVNLYYDKVEFVEDLLQVEDDQFLKIAICDLAGAEANSYRHFQQKSDILQVKLSGKIWVDLSHKLVDKGRAIALLQNKYSISIEETMAFGDYLNDLEMMQRAYFSYAMENAHPDIKKAARIRAKSNDENGVLEVLQQVLMRMN
ncbi:Cof-type HAD-IIB family hydrolase [Rhodocytophaga aerolata]|uniref:Cof-type HAD-IIB family hydrolase n=1 Tax=Rhodocytophaga aerolata TaxID=455078 RepID=A0ABT8RH80_9BACT|nr:Cof-type HAD-IIB family hydrolase [Rhodocytophaga aerolata]MDO1451461.1 Cof-type HAD-IIB family hydrolase [Rhodocytophaga aerolata]